MSVQITDVRRYPRFEVLEYAMVEVTGQAVATRMVLVDIGLGGAQLRSREPLLVCAVCIVHLHGENERPFDVRAEVRFSAPVPDSDLHMSGLRFLPAGHEDRRAVAEYVTWVFQRQGERGSAPQMPEL